MNKERRTRLEKIIDDLSAVIDEERESAKEY
jgi:hypothetical protein